MGVAVACAAHFLIGVDGVAVAIVLPTLQHDLGVAPIDAQWVLTAYGLAFGGTLLLAGRLGDLYGRRRLLVVGMVAFAGGSLVAGAASVLGVLIAARAAQGLGAAAAVPAALALIGSMFAPGPGRTRALSLLGAMASVGIMSGMLIGGVVTDVLGWRWVFWLMAPLALAAALAAPRVLPEARAETRHASLDVLGAVLIAGALLATLFGVTRIERAGPGAAVVVAPLVTGFGLLGAFVAYERRAAAPLVRFDILRVRSLRASALGASVNAVSFTAIVYLGTLYLQTALGYSALQAGLALLPLDAVAFLVVLLIGGPVARGSPRALLAGSFASTAIALLWLARAPVPATYVRDVMGPLVVLGCSLPLAFVVLTQEAIADVQPDDKGLASGIFETANHLFGGAVGVALYATVLAATAGDVGDAAGYRVGFLLATALTATLGTIAVLLARRRRARTRWDRA